MYMYCYHDIDCSPSHDTDTITFRSEQPTETNILFQHIFICCIVGSQCKSVLFRMYISTEYISFFDRYENPHNYIKIILSVASMLFSYCSVMNTYVRIHYLYVA